MGELGMKQMCSEWIPHFLRIDKIQAPFHTCTKNLVMITDESEFLTQVIIAHKLWIHHYDSLLKNKSSVWLHQCESQLKKRQQQKGAGKIVLITFFDCKGMIDQHYWLPGIQVNKDCYILVIDQLRINIRRKHLELVDCCIFH